jgi:hypothetical protein
MSSGQKTMPLPSSRSRRIGNNAESVFIRASFRSVAAFDRFH